MSLPYRVASSFAALLGISLLGTIALPAPSLGQARGETDAPRATPRPPAVHHHLYRAAVIICDTSDVHACHKEFARKHRAAH
jgi:hypothetical protein